MEKVNIVNPLSPKFDDTKVNIWNFIAEKNAPLVASMNNYQQQNVKTIFARKCTVRKIHFNEAKEFLRNNHIKGSTAAKFCFGLEHNNELIAVMTFGKSRYVKKFEYEIIRFASKANHHIPGGASKLLKYAISAIGSNSIFSYSENMIGVGNLYEKLGFTFLGETGAGFFWYKFEDGKHITFSRESKKYYVASKYPEDAEMIFNSTQYEYFTSKGFIKVYDMGNKRWGMNPIGTQPKIEKHKFDFVFVEHEGRITHVSETIASDFKQINLRKTPCREMIKADDVRLIPESLIQEFEDDGWVRHSRPPNNVGFTKITNGVEVKNVKQTELQTYLQNGWVKTNRNAKPKKSQPSKANTIGRIAIIKDGTKQLVPVDTARHLVLNDGWVLAAASCWKKASPQAKQLGKELGLIDD